MGRKLANKLTVNGAKLTDARVAAGLLQQDIADKLGCNRSAVCRWEQEFTKPNDVQIMAMADMLGTAGFIIGREK